MKSLLPLLFAFLPAVASGTVLMLDFGPIEAGEDQRKNSPYHASNEAFTGTHWNTLGPVNVSSGLVYADGEAAEGVTLTFGASQDSTLVDFSETPANSGELGIAKHMNDPESVLSGTSVGRDAVFTSAPMGNNLVGIKIGGLNAGTYEVYAVGVNTNNGLDSQSPSAFFVAAAGDLLDFETAGVAPSATTLIMQQATRSWIEGASYAKMKVELKEGDFLILVVDGLGPDQGGSENRGFLNAIQIVPLP